KEAGVRSVTRRDLWISAGLAFVAGYVDAVGFIETGGLFVSFMSGNSTQLGIEVLDGGVETAMVAVGLIVAFVIGVIIGGLAAGHLRDQRRWVVLGSAAALAAVAGLQLAGVDSSWRFLLIAAAMGALNTLYLADGRARVAITYATGTLVSVGLALSALLTRTSTTAWRRPLLLWGALAAGAVGGAGAYRLGSETALFAAAGALVVLMIVLSVQRRVSRIGRAHHS
ncbi:MAG: YoaK family protein, partial [Agrococcus casei]